MFGLGFASETCVPPSLHSALQDIATSAAGLKTKRAVKVRPPGRKLRLCPSHYAWKPLLDPSSESLAIEATASATTFMVAEPA